MSTVKVINVVHPSSATNNIVLDSSGNASFGGTLGMSSSFMRNRIINGAMVIDQRNAGASVTITANPQYTLDRWFAGVTLGSKISIQQNAGSVTPPAGFKNYLGVTSLAATTPGTNDVYYLQQSIEGYNISDLGFGAAGALTVTLSFWVRSSLSGTFGAVLVNASSNRSYPFNYTIASANTWTQITQTISGDTTGTWATDNSTGFQLRFGLGAGSTYQGTAGAWGTANVVTTTGATSVVGTNGATFYLTGVQLEVGSVATPFEREIFSITLAKAQRYYQTSYPLGQVSQTATNPTDGATFISINTSDTGNGGPLPVAMRATPTFATYSTNGSIAANSARQGPDGSNITAITLAGGSATNLPRLSKTAGFLPAGNVYSAQWTASAEL